MKNRNKGLLRPIAAVSVLALVLSVAGNALAQTAAETGANKGTSVGYLECNVSSGWGIIFGSSRDLTCVFTPTKGYPEHYKGYINKYGADIGYVRSAVILWAVLAPQKNLGRGALAGHYGGATAAVTAGVGAGLHALVGGFHNSIALQPLSIEGNTGLNVAAGVASMTLDWDIHHEIGPGKPKP
jgi:hypothetical protein